MLLDDLEVNRESLLNDVVIVLRNLSNVDADSISFSHLSEKRLLHFSVLLELALLAQLQKLIMKLLSLFVGRIDSFGLALVDEDLVQDQTVKKCRVHPTMVLCLQDSLDLLEDLKLELKE